MKIKHIVMMLLLCMHFGIVSYAKGSEDGGTWTYVSASVPYELEGTQVPPETAVLSLRDDLSGMEYEREVPLKKITEKQQSWVDGFSFPITVSGYDADVFLLGEMEIPAGVDLSFYGEELLEAAGLSSDYYRVESVEWIGESYEEGGIMFRDAVARGEKLVRQVEVLYGGQVRMPEVPVESENITEESTQESVFEETVPETRIAERAEETQSVQEVTEEFAEAQGFFEKAIQWFREHLTIVTVSAGVLFILIGVLVFWRYLMKKKSRD